jgi:hypothetical protein
MRGLLKQFQNRVQQDLDKAADVQRKKDQEEIDKLIERRRKVGDLLAGLARANDERRRGGQLFDARRAEIDARDFGGNADPEKQRMLRQVETQKELERAKAEVEKKAFEEKRTLEDQLAKEEDERTRYRLQDAIAAIDNQKKARIQALEETADEMRKVIDSIAKTEKGALKDAAGILVGRKMALESMGTAAPQIATMESLMRHNQIAGIEANKTAAERAVKAAEDVVAELKGVAANEKAVFDLLKEKLGNLAQIVIQ